MSYLGYNIVAKEIKETLLNSERPENGRDFIKIRSE